MTDLEPPRPGQITRGMGWATAGQVGGEVLRVLTGFALARFMSPDQFGVVQMVAVFANYAPVLLNFGFGSAIMMRRRTTNADLSTVFWFNSGVGVFLTVVFVVAAPWMAAFYERPEVEAVAVVLSLNFLLLAPSIVHRVVLQRDLRFRGLAVVDVAATVVSSVLAIALGSLGYGAWSLVVWTLSRSAVQTAGSIVLYPWRPSLVFSTATMREMSGLALHVTASETIAYVSASLDRLLVGRFLGAGALGIYDQAVRLMLLPVTNTSVVLGRVLWPALARLQDDRQRMKGLYLRSARLSLFVATPLLLGLAVAARPFVAVAYGPGWEALVPVLQLTAPAGLAAALLALTTSLFRSMGRADVELRIGVVRRVIVVAGAAAGLPWNVAGVAFGRLVGSMLGVPLYQRAVGRLVGLTARDQVANVGSIMVCGAAMSLAVAVANALIGSAPVLLALAVDASVGLVVYVGVASLFRDRSYIELRAMGAEWLAAARRAR